MKILLFEIKIKDKTYPFDFQIIEHIYMLKIAAIHVFRNIFLSYLIEQHDRCVNNACQNNASCVYTAQEYKCLCTPWYTGQHCQGE